MTALNKTLSRTLFIISVLLPLNFFVIFIPLPLWSLLLFLGWMIVAALIGAVTTGPLAVFISGADTPIWSLLFLWLALIGSCYFTTQIMYRFSLFSLKTLQTYCNWNLKHLSSQKAK